MNRRWRTISLVALVALSLGGVRWGVQAAAGSQLLNAGKGQGDNGLLAQLQTATGGKAQVAVHSETGKLRFFGTDAQHSVARPAAVATTATAEDAARAFLAMYGPLFGVRDQAQELAVESKAVVGTNEFIKFQQTYGGVPVLGGELVVQVDTNRNVVSANGELLPDLNASVTPVVDANTARDAGRCASWYCCVALQSNCGRQRPSSM